MKERPSFIGALIALGIALFFRIDAENIKIFTGIGATKLNSATFPKLWADIMIVLCLWVIIRSVIRSRKQARKSGSSEKASENTGSGLWALIVSNYETILTLGLMAGYYACLKSLGFVVATAIYLFLQMLILQRKEERKYLLPAIISIIATGIIYVVFRYGLEIVLPQGILPMI